MNARSVFKPRFLAEKLAAQTPDLKIISERIAAQILLGAHATRKAGGGEAFWQYREYISGDAPNSIDWRQSAKTDRVFVREKEQYRAQTYLFWVQRNADMDFCSDKKLLSKRQSANVIALALALLYARSSELIAFAGQGGAGHSERSLQNFESTLALSDPEALPSSHLKIPKSARMALIGDFLAPLEEIEKYLSALSHTTRNITLIQILDPAELALPYKGRALFEHGATKILVNNVRDIADEYAARINTHNDALKMIASKLGIHVMQHVTSDDPTTILLDLWRKSAEAVRGH